MGKKIYWFKKDVIGIFANRITIKKTKIKKNMPIAKKIIFLILKLKKKWTSDKKPIIKTKWAVGVCLVRKDIPKIIGIKSQ